MLQLWLSHVGDAKQSVTKRTDILTLSPIDYAMAHSSLSPPASPRPHVLLRSAPYPFFFNPRLPPSVRGIWWDQLFNARYSIASPPRSVRCALKRVWCTRSGSWSGLDRLALLTRWLRIPPRHSRNQCNKKYQHSHLQRIRCRSLINL